MSADKKLSFKGDGHNVLLKITILTIRSLNWVIFKTLRRDRMKYHSDVTRSSPINNSIPGKFIMCQRKIKD